MPETTNLALEFTGERFVPECVREIWYEHWHRYAFALSMAKGKRVLDLACGEGYGSNMLSTVANTVCGMDISPEAINHAKEKYQNKNLHFKQSSCDDIHLEDDSVDLVVSFETLEHVAPQEKMLTEFDRVLGEDGLLIISSPDKKLYSDETGFVNEYHLKELYRHEFESLIARHFPAYRLFGQKLLFQSAIWPLNENTGHAEFLLTKDKQAPQQARLYPAIYLVAVCARNQNQLDAQQSKLSFFGDAEETVYEHYNDEVRRNIHAAKVLKDYEEIIARQQKELDRLKLTISQINKTHEN